MHHTHLIISSLGMGYKRAAYDFITFFPRDILRPSGLFHIFCNVWTFLDGFAWHVIPDLYTYFLILRMGRNDGESEMIGMEQRIIDLFFGTKTFYPPPRLLRELFHA